MKREIVIDIRPAPWYQAVIDTTRLLSEEIKRLEARDDVGDARAARYARCYRDALVNASRENAREA